MPVAYERLAYSTEGDAYGIFWSDSGRPEYLMPTCEDPAGAFVQRVGPAHEKHTIVASPVGRRTRSPAASAFAATLILHKYRITRSCLSSHSTACQPLKSGAPHRIPSTGGVRSKQPRRRTVRPLPVKEGL